jgi:predicted outer membrane lipoprotein
MANSELRPAPDNPDEISVISVKSVEVAVAAFTAAIGVIVMFGSYSSGIGWGDTGPESGYFPFYVGLLMAAASVGTIVFTILKWRSWSESFVARGPLKHVVAVFLPICVYCVAIRLLGMYLASAFFIAWFMWREKGDGRHGVRKIILVPITIVALCYVIFDRWFDVPLYAGPLLPLLGIGN